MYLTRLLISPQSSKTIIKIEWVTVVPTPLRTTQCLWSSTTVLITSMHCMKTPTQMMMSNNNWKVCIKNSKDWPLNMMRLALCLAVSITFLIICFRYPWWVFRWWSLTSKLTGNTKIHQSYPWLTGRKTENIIGAPTTIAINDFEVPPIETMWASLVAKLQSTIHDTGWLCEG